MKFLIILVSRSRYAPPKVGEFIFNTDFGKYLYKGRPLDVDEFNEGCERLMDNPNPNMPYAISARVLKDAVDEVVVEPVEQPPVEAPAKDPVEPEVEASEPEAPVKPKGGRGKKQ